MKVERFLEESRPEPVTASAGENAGPAFRSETLLRRAKVGVVSLSHSRLRCDYSGAFGAMPDPA